MNDNSFQGCGIYKDDEFLKSRQKRLENMFESNVINIKQDYSIKNNDNLSEIDYN